MDADRGATFTASELTFLSRELESTRPLLSAAFFALGRSRCIILRNVRRVGCVQPALDSLQFDMMIEPANLRMTSLR